MSGIGGHRCKAGRWKYVGREQAQMDREKGSTPWLAGGELLGERVQGLVCSHSLNPVFYSTAAAGTRFYS